MELIALSLISSLVLLTAHLLEVISENVAKHRQCPDQPTTDNSLVSISGA